MARYEVINKQSGQVVYGYTAEAAVEWDGFEFSTHEHRAVSVVVEQPAMPVFEYLPLEFLRRFTPQERIAARNARLVDPILNDFFSLLEISPNIRSDDPDVSAGLGYMVMTGLIAPSRIAEILGGV